MFIRIVIIMIKVNFSFSETLVNSVFVATDTNFKQTTSISALGFLILVI